MNLMIDENTTLEDLSKAGFSVIIQKNNLTPVEVENNLRSAASLLKKSSTEFKEINGVEGVGCKTSIKNVDLYFFYR